VRVKENRKIKDPTTEVTGRTEKIQAKLAGEEKRVKKTVAALVVMIVAAISAGASDKADVTAVVQRWAASFNGDDLKTGNSVCAEEAVVIDDFPPHVWQGPDACAQWFTGYQALAAKLGMTQPKIIVRDSRHVDVESGYAYFVAPVTLSFKKAGKPVTDHGVITMALHKSDAGWRITGFAWADQ
jgi:ketosteroid isomerase-like protein